MVVKRITIGSNLAILVTATGPPAVSPFGGAGNYLTITPVIIQNDTPANRVLNLLVPLRQAIVVTNSTVLIGIVDTVLVDKTLINLAIAIVVQGVTDLDHD